MKRIKPSILASGQIVGNYRVVRELLGRHYPPFYEALELPSNQPMLLYPVRPEMRTHIEAFRQQHQGLEHPALPKIIPLNELADGHWILAVVPPRGIPLNELIDQSIQKQKPLGVHGLHLLVKIAEFFAYVHEHGVFSLRLHPKKLAVRFVNDEWFISNADFSVVSIPLLDARTEDLPQPNPEDEERGGKYYYRVKDPELDVYMLGVLAYECLLGQRPVSDRSYDELRLHPRSVEHIPIEFLDPRMPVGLPQLVLRMLKGDPTMRPTMRQVHDELIHKLRDLGA